MACCAVMLPPQMHQPLASKVFRGDSEDMVDRLIEACQEATAPVAGYTGFGRALEPASAWLCEETAPVPCSTTRGSASSPNVKKGPNTSASKKFPQGSHKHARSSPTKSSSMPSSPEHKRGGAACAAQRGHTTKTASNSALAATPAKAAAPATSNAFACPAIAASPKPEAVPMPTSSLLTRALRARSPSPDKAIDCGARLLQRLQAVRA